MASRLLRRVACRTCAFPHQDLGHQVHTSTSPTHAGCPSVKFERIVWVKTRLQKNNQERSEGLWVVPCSGILPVHPARFLTKICDFEPSPLLIITSTASSGRISVVVRAVLCLKPRLCAKNQTRSDRFWRVGSRRTSTVSCTQTLYQIRETLYHSKPSQHHPHQLGTSRLLSGVLFVQKPVCWQITSQDQTVVVEQHCMQTDSLQPENDQRRTWKSRSPPNFSQPLDPRLQDRTFFIKQINPNPISLPTCDRLHIMRSIFFFF